jgi:hypothetical protein
MDNVCRRIATVAAMGDVGSSSWQTFVPGSLAGERAWEEHLGTPQPIPDAVARAARRVIADVDGAEPLPITLVSYTQRSEDPVLGMLIIGVGEAMYGFGVDPAASDAELLWEIAEGIQEYLSETALAWGQARPVCPGHPHPAIARVEGGKAVWICPRDDRQLGVVGELH